MTTATLAPTPSLAVRLAPRAGLVPWVTSTPSPTGPVLSVVWVPVVRDEGAAE